MADQSTVSFSPGGPSPATVRAILDRYIAAIDRAGGQPPPVNEFLTGLAEPHRPPVRVALEALAASATPVVPHTDPNLETASIADPGNLDTGTIDHTPEPAGKTPLGTIDHAPTPDGTIDHAPTADAAGGTIDHTPEPGESPNGTVDYAGDTPGEAPFPFLGEAEGPRTVEAGSPPASGPSGPHTPGTANRTDREGPNTGDYTPESDGGDKPTPTAKPTGPKIRRVYHIPGYEVLGELGRGGMGVVYKARQTKLNRLVAVKLMLNADHAGSSARERFDAEAQAIARMQHPNIVQVFEIGDTQGMPFFSLEFVAGGTLAQKVSKNLMPAKQTAATLITLARAMQYAHDQGIIHRDLKPANILIGDNGIPKITDFGLAKKLEDDSGLTRMGAIVGTPSFMPPEQARGELDKIGPLADVYALGAILYDLLTGRAPFRGANVLETLEQVRTQEPLAPSSLQPGVPADLETICLKTLQKDPAKRYQSAGEFADDLQRFLNGEPILARPIGNVERAVRWCKRNPRVAGLLGTVFGLLLLVTGGSATAAVVFNQQKTEIAQQRDEIGKAKDVIEAREKVVSAQKDTIAGQLDVITAKEKEVSAQKKVAEDRLEAFRTGVDGFTNEAPSILEGYPLTGPAEDLLALTIKLLEDAQGKADDRGLTDRGRLALLTRQGVLAQLRNDLTEAERIFVEARKVGEKLVQPGSPERDKAAGNLALVCKLEAGLCITRGLDWVRRNDAVAARQQLDEAIRLNHLALELEKRVLEKPESGEIKEGEARTWVGNTAVSLAEAHRIRAVAAETPERAKEDLVAALGFAREAEANIKAGIESGVLAPRVKERNTLKLALAGMEYGRIAEKLDDLAGADAGFGRAIAVLSKLVTDFPKNLFYRRNLSIAGAEYGDILLMRKNDPAAARKAYTLGVFHLLPIARPPELAPYTGTLALNYYRIATATLRTAKPGDPKDPARADALRLYGLCLEIREAQLRDAERTGVLKKDPLALTGQRINLMLVQARVGKYKEAAAIAADIAEKYPGNGGRLFYAACGFALASDAVPDAEPDLKAEYRDRAIVTLLRAADNGYADLAALERDPDLEPIRTDPRFKEVLDRVKTLQGKK